MTGAVARITPVGIVGFVIMLGSATVALTAIRGQRGPAAPDPRSIQHPSRGGFTVVDGGRSGRTRRPRSEEHTSELQSLMRILYAVFCLTTKTQSKITPQ